MLPAPLMMRAITRRSPRWWLPMLLLQVVGVALTSCVDRDVEGEGRPEHGAHADSATAAEGVAAGVSPAGEGAHFVQNVVGFQGPESAKYDAEQDAFFVSNMAGLGSAKDGNGYISRFNAATPDSASVFVAGGKNGVVLDAPKGLAIHGDTLWAADISVLRGFDRHTGAVLATLDFAPFGAVLLNDVAIGPDGNIYITDTGIIMGPKGVVHPGPDRIFVVKRGAQIAVAAQGPQLRRPNGITWDPVGKRWIVVSFDPFVGEVAEMPLDMKSRRVIRTGKGQLDGVEVLPDGRILFTSWADSSIHLLANGRDRRIIREVPVPADIGIDTKRHRLAIPMSMLERVELWNIEGLR
jgi:sugar lactone lactonase YvrE